MSEECKNFEKRAKGLEKEDPVKAVELFRQAANCYSIKSEITIRDEAINSQKNTETLKELSVRGVLDYNLDIGL